MFIFYDLQYGEAGCVRKIETAAIDTPDSTRFDSGVQNFTVNGKIYGVPNDLAPMVFWYNKDLCQKAGVDPTKIQDWDDFVDAVKKCQVAGITPVAC